MNNQCRRMITHMREHGSISSLEAQSEYGIMRASSRVYDLRNMGFEIKTTMEKGRNRYGEATRYARYTLAERGRTNEAKNDQSRNSGSA